MDRWHVNIMALCLVGCGAGHGASADAAMQQGHDAVTNDGATTVADGPQATSCTPAPASTAPLDPSCVYLLGTLTPGTVGRTLAPQTTFLDDFRVGFGEL